MEFLLSRPLIIALAVLGGIASGWAQLLYSRGAGGDRAKRLNVAGYALMGVSMLLFVIAGFSNG